MSDESIPELRVSFGQLRGTIYKHLEDRREEIGQRIDLAIDAEIAAFDFARVVKTVSTDLLREVITGEIEQALRTFEFDAVMKLSIRRAGFRIMYHRLDQMQKEIKSKQRKLIREHRKKRNR